MLPSALRLSVLTLLLCAMVSARPLFAQTESTLTRGSNREAIQKSRKQAVNFLKTSQAREGYWTSPDALGVSGLITYSLLLSGVPTSDPQMDLALKYLTSHIQPDGGIYVPKSNHGNYETSICMLALELINQDGKYTETLRKAEQYIRKVQWDESESIDRTDVKFGGAGYGRTGDRPDLSNTVFFLDALQAAGAKKDDPAVQNAVVFLSRCQNLESEHNTTKFAAPINDGGFYYTPAAGGSSPAGTTPEGGLRSYGSMTYAGLKSMVYAGLTPDDARVKAANQWITKFYSVHENPGMGQQGLYYYYLMFAKTYHALNLDQIVDAQGKSHDWRSELSEQICTQQLDSGAWLNKSDRWMEGTPELATAYALIALNYCELKSPQGAR